MQSNQDLTDLIDFKDNMNYLITGVPTNSPKSMDFYMNNLLLNSKYTNVHGILYVH